MTIRDDLTNEEYHAQDGLSASGAKRILRSVAHFLVPVTTTSAMELGTAIHTAVLEPDVFAARYITKPAGLDMRYKEGKEWAAQHADKIIMYPEKYEVCMGISEAVRRNKIASAILGAGRAELSYMVTDPEYDVPLRIRPDFLSDRGFMVDLKSTQDARADAFARACVTFDYDLQQAFYQRVHKIETGEDVDFLFLAAEKDSPYAVATYTLDESFVDRGTKSMHQALRAYADWYHSDRSVPEPYLEAVAELSPPPWAMKGVYE